MKRSRVSPEPNNSAPCRARFLRNKIFFFFFHLLLLSIINYFFFKLQIFSTSSRVWPWQSSGTLSVQCVYMQSLFLEGISVLHTTVHTGIVIPLVTSKQRSKGARAWQQLLYTLFFLDFHGFEFNMTDYIMLHSLPCQWQRQIKMSHGTKCVA